MDGWMDTHGLDEPQTIRQYVVIGRREPTAADPNPQLYKMQIFAANEVVARSRFWFILHEQKHIKKATGEILSVNEVTEPKAASIKNYAIWVRYNSRSGTHNMYREYRAGSLCAAVEHMYQDMAGRHRARQSTIKILKTAVIKPSEVRREALKQMLDSKVKFPLYHSRPRASHPRFKTTFAAKRPSTFVG